VHRPFTDWDKVGRRGKAESLEGKIYTGLQRLIRMRVQHPVFAGQEMQVINTANPHVLGYVRLHDHERVLVFAISARKRRGYREFAQAVWIGFTSCSTCSPGMKYPSRISPSSRWDWSA